jgi:hypothetical protein
MKQGATLFAAVCVALALGSAALAQKPSAAPTDVYLVSFFKAAPGQATALLTTLQQQDPKNPMAGHSLLLRHAQGSDWDYAVVQHVGATATVRVAPPPDANAKPPQPTQAWHTDTYVAGPSWDEFSKQMGMTASGGVYVVSVHRPVPAHRRQLLDSLTAPDANAKVATGRVLLEHIDGAINILTIDRFNSWQDFSADMTANPTGSKGWLDVRQHSAYHEDTLAERVR